MATKKIKTDTYSHDKKIVGRILPPLASDIDFDYLDVVRIPCERLKADPLSLIQTRLIDIDTEIVPRTHTEELEALLQRVPDIKTYKKAIEKADKTCNFSWARRTLIKIPGKCLGQFADAWEDDYLMYACFDEEANDPVNEYMRQLDEESDVRVFGDAFVFKQKSVLAVNAKKRTRYLQNFVESANEMYGRPDCETEKLLRQFLIASSKEDEKPSSRKTPTHLQVVRIPCAIASTNLLGMVKIPLTSIDLSTNKFNNLEKRLGCVPNLRDSHPYAFRWTHRSLRKLPSEALSPFAGPREAEYMMYMCLDQRSKFQRNSFLDSYCSDVPVYGDAFVFRMESTDIDLGHPKYIDMPDWFAKDAKSLWGNDSLHIMGKLIEASSEHDKK